MGMRTRGCDDEGMGTRTRDAMMRERDENIDS